MGWRNQASVFVGRFPEVRDKSEDFRWDPVDWRKAVPPGPNQAEDLECVLLENVELEAKDENA